MATNQAKRRRHRRSFGAIRQLQSGNYQASFKDLSGSIQRAPQTYSTREAADRFLVVAYLPDLPEIGDFFNNKIRWGRATAQKKAFRAK